MTYVEDFESGNIKNTDEVNSLLLCVQRLVDALHEPFEQTIEHCLGQGAHRGYNLSEVSTLSDHFSADLNARLQQVLVQFVSFEAKKFGDSFSFLTAIGFGLFLSRPLLELQTANLHDSGRNAVDRKFLLLAEAEHVECILWNVNTKFAC